MEYSSIIEVGPVSHQSSSKRNYVLCALAGGAMAAILLPSVGPALLWTASTTGNQVAIGARTVDFSSVSSSSNQLHSSSMEAPQSMHQQLSDSPPSASMTMTPLIFAASGILMVAAALVRFFRSPAATPEYSMLVATAEKYRLDREMREKQRADQVQREIQERLLRLASMGAYVPQSNSSPSSNQTVASVGTVAEWETRQQARERMEREKAEAKQREIQERLARLSKLSSTSTTAPQPSSGGVNEWEMRQQQRERREREIAESKQREIQERLARLASMGALSTPPSTAAVPSSNVANVDWERRQQQREQREREIAEAKQREIQERLARLAKLGTATPATTSTLSSAPVTDDWEKRQQERARRENEKAAAARREIEERMARLARLSSGH